MDVFRFVKLPMRANDPVRRYQLVRGQERDYVGDVEIEGDVQLGSGILLSVLCFPLLSDAAREDALATARRFLDELVIGWGREYSEVPGPVTWVERSDGSFDARLEYRVT